VDPHQIYEDPDLEPQDNPGEISKQALHKIKSAIEQLSKKPDQLERWLGEYSTQAKNDCCIEPLEYEMTTDDIKELIEGNVTLYTNEGSRFAYSLNSENKILFFVDGRSHELDSEQKNLQKMNLEFVQTLCKMRPASINHLLPDSTSSQILNIVLDLLHKGSLYFET